MSDYEEHMHHLAVTRGQVLVDMPDGKRRPATLLSWRPHDGRSRARVQFATGRFRSVDTKQVIAPTGVYRTIEGRVERRYASGDWLPIPADEVLTIQDAMHPH